MKKILYLIKENYKLVTGVLIIGIFTGWLVSGLAGRGNSPTEGFDSQPAPERQEQETTVWTCSMHPQIKQDHEGDCPICGMDLIPLSSMAAEGDEFDPDEIMMSESAAKLADIQTTVVRKAIPEKTIFLNGKVASDERRIAGLTARFGGRIEELFVNFTGEYVQKGKKLATIYSPELVTAQRELIEALTFKDSRPALYDAAKTKLKLWDLTDAQIRRIEEQGEPILYFEVLAPISGTVMMRHVSAGDYVKMGDALFMVADLSRVWVMFDAYEKDLPWISVGDKMEFSVQALPGKIFTSEVTYIDPFIDPTTRSARVRVEINNSEMKLKPEMFTSGKLYSKIAEEEPVLLIPASSILWTGKRSVVYVRIPERESPSFLYREIELGPQAGDQYVVADGLMEGETIVTNGVFKIDAAAQLEGKKSMMNPEGSSKLTEHDHGSMQMQGNSKSGDDIPGKGMYASDHQGRGHSHFKVGGNCGMCKDRIEKAALTISGVTAARWDKESMMLHLDHAENTDIMEVHRVIAASGHDTELIQAPDDVYKELPGCCLYERFEYDSTAAHEMEHAMVRVLGNCGMCKTRIEEAALSVEGVASAEWTSETQMLHVEFDPGSTSLDSIQKVITAVGHDTEDHKAPDEIYDALPGCCLYER